MGRHESFDPTTSVLASVLPHNPTSTAASVTAMLAGRSFQEAMPRLALPIETGLREACLAQVERLNRWDESAGSLTEEQGDAEMDRWGAVCRRAIDEPAGDLRDLAGKAQLMLADLDRFYPLEGYRSEEWLLMRAILRDAISLADRETAHAPPPAQRVVDQIDFASATIDELRAIHDTVEMVGGVALAVTWQGQCRLKGSNYDLNAAGRLMQWLGDALTDVESAAAIEVEKRTPSDVYDRQTRAAIRARSIIANGDVEETAAFARELVGLAAAQAAEA